LRILVAYYTLTGNTEKIACAMHEEMQSHGHEVHLKSIGEVAVDSLQAYDLVCLGAPCHDADLAKPLKKLLAAISPSAPFKMAGFATHASPTPEGGEKERELYEAWAAGCADSFARTSQEKEIELLGYFSCQGAASPAIEAFIHSVIVTDEKEWEAYLAELRKHPNEDDMEQARVFARALLSQFDIKAA